MDWQAQQHEDELMRMQRAEELIRASEYRALDTEERKFLASEVGISDIFREGK